MQTYIAINLNDFHKNAHSRQTSAQICSINAKDISQAKDFLIHHYPNASWSLVSERQFNKHLVLEKSDC